HGYFRYDIQRYCISGRCTRSAPGNSPVTSKHRLMPAACILVATWENGLFSACDERIDQEIADRSVRGLASDGRGGTLAVVGGHSIWRRSADGRWTAIADCERELSCCVAMAGAVFAGTEDANIVRLEPDRSQRRLNGFDTVEGRATWYAGTAIVDGNVVGPPLGIRSMTATCDGSALLANVHVGGIPRSTDCG